MEVRCASCRKLFRVADEKIIGSGVKFPCTRCGEYVKITREDFEQYQFAKIAAPAPASFERAAPNAASAGHLRTQTADATSGGGIPGFDLGMPPADVSVSEDISGVKSDHRQSPALQPKPEAKAAPKPRPEQMPGVSPAYHDPFFVSGSPSLRDHPSPVPDAAVRSSSFGKKFFLFLLVLLVLGGAAFGVKYYLGPTFKLQWPFQMKLPFQIKWPSQIKLPFQLEWPFHKATKAANVTLPDGLQVQNPAGTVDPVTGDLVITGSVENTTGKPRAAWFVLAEVYDAQGTVLIRAKLLNGKQVYTRRDYEIMAKRGINVEELKQKVLREQALVIPQKGSISFEMRIFEPPVGVASFNATLQPFDPVQLYNEIAEEQK